MSNKEIEAGKRWVEKRLKKLAEEKGVRIERCNCKWEPS